MRLALSKVRKEVRKEVRLEGAEEAAVDIRISQSFLLRRWRRAASRAPRSSISGMARHPTPGSARGARSTGGRGCVRDRAGKSTCCVLLLWVASSLILLPEIETKMETGLPPTRLQTMMRWGLGEGSGGFRFWRFCRNGFASQLMSLPAAA